MQQFLRRTEIFSLFPLKRSVTRRLLISRRCPVRLETFIRINLTEPAFAIGSEIRTVSVQLVASARNGVQQPVCLPDAVSTLVIFSGIRGTITGPMLLVIQSRLFTSGAAFAAPTTDGDDFGPLDPSTWAAAFAAVFAEYALKPQEE